MNWLTLPSFVVTVGVLVVIHEFVHYLVTQKGRNAVPIWLQEGLAKFLETLRSTPDGDGSLLDHSLLFYGGGMANPNQHAAGPLPMLAIGGGAGRGNRHLQARPGTPVGNLWVSVANKYDSPVDSFGVSTGRVDLF